VRQGLLRRPPQGFNTAAAFWSQPIITGAGAADDAAAILHAATINPQTDCEVWLENRLIARIPAGGEPVIGQGPDPV